MNYTSSYVEKELIGKGYYGRVYLVYHQVTLKPFVAKKIQLQGMTEDEQTKAMKQVRIHQHLKHKNILQFRQYFLENQVLIMIMQYCQFGDLSVYIKTRKQKGQYFEQPLIVNLFVQMLFGLNYIHENKVLHRDIKTQNIFIDSEGTIKLADFGISKILEHTQHLASTIVGTPYYLSPEACSNAGYSFKSDIWSLGCVLYQLCTLQHPFSGDNILILAKKISSQEPKSISQKYSSQLSQLIKSMLRKNPQQRPTIRQILESKYISEYLIRFKMNNPTHYDHPSSQQTQSRQHHIYETSSNFQNEFLNLQYQNGKIQQINNQLSPNKTKHDFNKIDEMAISPQKSKTDNLRQKCIQKMGTKLFEQIYTFMKTSQSKNITESKIQQQLKNKYSKKQFQMSMDVAQLLYMEQMQGK